MRIPFYKYQENNKDTANWITRRYLHLSSKYIGFIQEFGFTKPGDQTKILFTLVELNPEAIISNKQEFASITEASNWLVKNYDKELSTEVL